MEYQIWTHLKPRAQADPTNPRSKAHYKNQMKKQLKKLKNWRTKKKKKKERNWQSSSHLYHLAFSHSRPSNLSWPSQNLFSLPSSPCTFLTIKTSIAFFSLSLSPTMDSQLPAIIFLTLVLCTFSFARSSTIGVGYISRILEIQDRERAPPSVQVAAARAVLRRLLPSHSSSFDFQIVSKVFGFPSVSFLFLLCLAAEKFSVSSYNYLWTFALRLVA